MELRRPKPFRGREIGTEKRIGVEEFHRAHPNVDAVEGGFPIPGIGKGDAVRKEIRVADPDVKEIDDDNEKGGGDESEEEELRPESAFDRFAQEEKNESPHEHQDPGEEEVTRTGQVKEEVCGRKSKPRDDLQEFPFRFRE